MTNPAKERTLYPLMSRILPLYWDDHNYYFSPHYFVTCQYLLMEMKWMYLIYIRSTHELDLFFLSFFFFFSIPGEGGARAMSVMSGSSLPQRHYCLGERTSVAFQKSCMRER